MSYKIAFFDIDGTLVNDQKEIPQDTIDAIRELQATGVEAVIATGRAPYFFHQLSQQLGIHSFVSLNGAYVVYKGKPVFQREIPRLHIEALVNHANQHNHCLVFEGHSQFYTTDENRQHMIDAVASLRVELPAQDPDFWKKESIYQIFLHCEAHEEHLYHHAVPELRYIRWHKTALDVLPNDGSKALGIKELLNHLGLSASDAIAFGDGLNDIEMLQAVGLGIAMGNSHDEVKPYADYVTTHVDEQGIRNGLLHAGLLKAPATRP